MPDNETYGGTTTVGVRWGELVSIDARPIVLHGSTLDTGFSQKNSSIARNRNVDDGNCGGKGWHEINTTKNTHILH
jgi:hypothetical protein